MLTFNATLYNLTSGEELYSGQFSFGKYVGSSDVIDMPLQTISGTDIDVSYNAGSNVAREIEQAAKLYRSRTGTWPTLRLYVYRYDSLCFQWSHNSPNDLTLFSSRGTKQLVNALQWNDSNLWDSSIFSFTWTTVDSVTDLLNFPGDVQFGSLYHGIPLPEVTASTPCTIKISNMHMDVQNASNVLITDADHELVYAKINNQNFSGVKKFAGAGYFYGTLQNNEATDGPGTRPAINRRAGTMGFFPAKRVPNNILTWLGNHTGGSTQVTVTYKNKPWSISWLTLFYNSNIGNVDKMTNWGWSTPHIPWAGSATFEETFSTIADVNEYDYDTYAFDVYYILTDAGQSEPGSDVDPENPDAPPPQPSDPDDEDPYTDPGDPEDPQQPPRPPSDTGGGDPPPAQEPEDVEDPPTPPAHAINSRFVTLYTPSLSQLNSLAEYLWSSSWTIESFKKVFANPIDCILGLMIFPALSAPTGTKNLNVGNLDTGISMSYVSNQYVKLDCGSFKLEEFYASYLDYDPYTKVEIFLPYIGMEVLSADDVMNKTIHPKYTIDLLSGACVCNIEVDGTIIYTFAGSCATPIPVSGNDWSNMVNSIIGVVGAGAAIIATGGSGAAIAGGVVASSSLAVNSTKQRIMKGGSIASAAGLMGTQIPYLIVTRPNQAIPAEQNSFMGYPSFITQSLGSCRGFTQVEHVHLEHVPATSEELLEIERLLKEGVFF